MKTILSLFDYTGEWSAPFLEAGHDVIQFDLKHDPSLMDIKKLSVSYFQEALGIEWVDAILAAPPCTDFTVAGAQYWKKKDLSGQTAISVEYVRQVLRCVEYWKPDFWVLENPVGRLPKLVPELGRAKLMFDPCDFAGWTKPLVEDLAALEVLRTKTEFTAADVELVKRTNTYTKRTQLWGDFNLPEIYRIEPVKVCAQGSWLQRLGGKTEKTKAARSVTPAGFAQAFFTANDWSDKAIAGWGGTSLDKIEAEENA